MGHSALLALLFASIIFLFYGVYVENTKKDRERIRIAEQKSRCLQECSGETGRLNQQVCRLLCAVDANAAQAEVRGK